MEQAEKDLEALEASAAEMKAAGVGGADNLADIVREARVRLGPFKGCMTQGAQLLAELKARA